MEPESEYTWVNKEVFTDKHDIVKYFCAPNSVSSIILKYLWNKTSKENSAVERVDICNLLQHPTMSNKQQALALSIWQNYRNTEMYERQAHGPELASLLDATKVVQSWVKSKAYSEGVGFDGVGLVMYTMASLLVDILERALRIDKYVSSGTGPNPAIVHNVATLERGEVSAPSTNSSTDLQTKNSVPLEKAQATPNTKASSGQVAATGELANKPKLLEYPNTPFRVEGSLRDIKEQKGKYYLNNKKLMILDGAHAQNYASFKKWNGTVAVLYMHTTPPKVLSISSARKVGVLKE